ncbi:hypothetical protein Pfo_020020 [Paulownia fortunei]|nr:hypothetical protein Pfo_020020 [Paulownia fortunei]
MASETLISDLVDPLSGLSGPSLFPRTITASIGRPVPADYKDIDSVHQLMKSLKELRSPEKLMNEAKRIVDGGAELLESNLTSFAENMGMRDAIAAKGKDRPQERRRGLGLARKRAPFSLKTSVSQPSVNLEPTLDIDRLQDPDEYFDAYERLENAKKEIQKQLGGNTDNLNQHKPSIACRRRRPGILGKSYNYKHRYSSAPFENDYMLMSSQETVERDISNIPKDDSKEKLFNPDPIPDVDLEEVELAVDVTVSVKKTENKVSNILDELLSCNNEDLDGDGALNLLQERLNIKPLDLEYLCMPELNDAGRTTVSTVGESLLKPLKGSLVIDSVLKNVKSKPPMGHEQVTKNPVNPVTSITAPGSPSSSLSLSKKRTLLSNPLRSPNVDLSVCRNASPAQPIDKLAEQVDAPKDLSMPIELESHVEVEITEPVISNMDALKVIGSANSLPDQFVDENTTIRSAKACNTPNEEPYYNIEETRNIENLHDNHSNPSVLEDEAMDAPSSQHQFDAEQQPEVHQTKLQISKRKAGEKSIRKAHPMRKSLADSGTSFETGIRRSKRIKMRPLEYWKGERFLYGRVDDSLKLIGVKYISLVKGNINLKVKPYIKSESSEFKELLELAARH